MPTDPTPGEIVTFYSYKGGTGRTMAVANTAAVLAERVSATERVLVVDWDLEAPGLHKFLPGLAPSTRVVSNRDSVVERSGVTETLFAPVD